MRLYHPILDATVEVAHTKTAGVLRRSGWVDSDPVATSGPASGVAPDDDGLEADVEDQPHTEG